LTPPQVLAALGVKSVDQYQGDPIAALDKAAAK